MIKKCKYCKKEYTLESRGQYYCSVECRENNLPIIKCLNCKKKFSIQKYRIKSAKFCSRECQHEYKDDSIEHKCKHCGVDKTFKSNRWRCLTCDRIYKKENGKEYRNKKRKSNPRSCSICGSHKKFYENKKVWICEKCVTLCKKCGKKRILLSGRLRCVDCDKKYRDSTKEKRLEKLREYRKNNIEIVRFWSSNRQNRKRNSLGDHTFDDWNKLKEQYNYTCLCCGKSEPEIKLTEDHIVPLSRGGSNYIENIQPLCQICNSTKNNKTIDFRN